ncbi:MAG: hypothetical protein CMF96_08165 [Candidatus Marinimicrobia bacterium]|nr:hypothetical protein [Candidatus Neomarinimicrobiota bacterium]|tara:strand:- start:4241 stop:5140 length:900 start_codon:yes stop_codon:yes gene_type:complete
MSSFKNFIPPFLLNQLQYIKAYITFLPHMNLVKQNHIYRDIHKRNNCFILGSGKSIDSEDILLLKNEIVIGVNSFVNHPNFSELFNSDVIKYYFIAPIHGPYTEEHWKDHFMELEKKLPLNVINIFGVNNYQPSTKDIIDKYDLFKNRKILWYFANIVNNSSLYKPLQKDLNLTSNIWSSYTGSILALISALYMGFENIYLLGMDHDYFLHKEGEARFKGIDSSATLLKEEKKVLKQRSQINNKHQSSYMREEFEALSEIFLQYERIGNLFPNKIFNLGKNSLLDMFPHKDLTSLIEGK